LLAVASVGLSVTGPRLLGQATDVIFNGFIGNQFPAGIDRAEAVSQLRESGEEVFADMVEAMEDLVPGQGVDFTALRNVLIVVLAVYVGTFLAGWLQAYILNGIVQNAMRQLRSDVEDKVNSLPLRYFDRQ